MSALRSCQMQTTKLGDTV